MKTSTKLIAVGALMGTLGFAGVARVVYATQPQTPVAFMPGHHYDNQMAQASHGDREVNDNAKQQAREEQESAKLQSLAKITPQQAQKAAEVAQGGQAKTVKLENENGNLVYDVVIGHKEVKVDAGNGRVLYVETGEHEDKETRTHEDKENKKAKASRPRSSIQVNEPPGGDGDGETNDDG